MAMDDLSDDGVSPPEWQSGSEREPEDDKEIEGNEPDDCLLYTSPSPRD